jgi:hypothetical protein
MLLKGRAPGFWWCTSTRALGVRSLGAVRDGTAMQVLRLSATWMSWRVLRILSRAVRHVRTSGSGPDDSRMTRPFNRTPSLRRYSAHSPSIHWGSPSSIGAIVVRHHSSWAGSSARDRYLSFDSNEHTTRPSRHRRRKACSCPGIQGPFSPPTSWQHPPELGRCRTSSTCRS